MEDKAPATKNTLADISSETSPEYRDASEIDVDFGDYNDIEQYQSTDGSLAAIGNDTNLFQNDENTDSNENLGENDQLNDPLSSSDNNKDTGEKPVIPIEDPYEKATKYLAKHNVIGLFQTITADIAYRKPENPIQFMIDEIEKLQEIDRRRKGVIVRKSVDQRPQSNGSLTGKGSASENPSSSAENNTDGYLAET